MGLKCANASTRRSQASTDSYSPSAMPPSGAWRDIGIASQVSDGCLVRGKKTSGTKMMVHEGEERCGDLFRPREIAILQHGDLAQRIQLVKFR